MKFDINNYKGTYVMHCETEEAANTFCEYLHSIGRAWCSGQKYLGNTCYYCYKKDMAYAFNIGQYGSTEFYKKRDYTILEFSNFDWSKEFTKADLKTGDVILRRNGDVEIVNRELETLICKDGGYNLLKCFRNDLTHSAMKEYDIIEVRRPKEKCDCCFDAISSCGHRRGTLVYERKEVEEMTLEQVCRLLGKEIKIIK